MRHGKVISTAIRLIGEYFGSPCGEFHRADISGIVNQTLGGVETSADSIRSIPATSSRTSAPSSNIASSPPTNEKPVPPTEEPSSTSASRAIKPSPEKIFYYPDAKWKPAYRIVKYPTPPGAKKKFWQERFENGRWVPGLGVDENGVNRSFIPYPYNFLRLMDERTRIVFIVEGEKCADALQAILDAGDSSRQRVVTTIAGGASNMKHWGAITPHTDGKAVIILPDNDTPGHKGAMEAAESILAAGYTESVSLVEFAITPHGEAAPDKYDIADWIGEHRADGNTDAEISTLFLAHVQTHKKIITKENLAAMKQSALISAQAEEKMPTIQICNFSEFLKKDFPPPEYLFYPILPKAGLTMIYAEREIGKTSFALTVAYATAGGLKLFDTWQAETPHKVLYLDGEMRGEDIQSRLDKIAAGFFPKELPDPDNFRIFNHGAQDEFRSLNLTKMEGRDALEPWLEGIELLVIDNLSTLCKTGRSNEEESWTLNQEYLLELRHRGITVLVVHHAGKNGEQRGTSAKEDIMDISLKLFRPNDHEPSEGSRFILEFKNRQKNQLIIKN